MYLDLIMKLKKINNREHIFDVVRKKYVKNTPEEWVRQNTINFLNTKKGYPISLMSIERGSSINGLQKRSDIICFNKDSKAILLVECKAPNVKLSSKALDQALIYHKVVKSKYIMITNGTKHFCYKFKNNEIKPIGNIPYYS